MNSEHVKKQATRMGGHEPTHANLITALLYAICYVLKYGAKQRRVDAAAVVGRGKHKLVCMHTVAPCQRWQSCDWSELQWAPHGQRSVELTRYTLGTATKPGGETSVTDPFAVSVFQNVQLTVVGLQLDGTSHVSTPGTDRPLTCPQSENAISRCCQLLSKKNKLLAVLKALEDISGQYTNCVICI